MHESEHDIQIALFDFLALVQYQIPETQFILHVPNGEYRTKATAARLKRMGVRPGVPDILILVPANGYHGMTIELKKPGGRLSEHQERWARELITRDYYAITCTDWQTAAAAILEYLGYRPEKYGLPKSVLK